MEKNKSKESDNVRVIVRCRPMNQTETESNCTQVVMVRTSQTITSHQLGVIFRPCGRINDLHMNKSIAAEFSAAQPHKL